ncbi:DUF2306 domain-containing protein [Christiangramia sabulilitoris]|uniref:DUF2306 domain-containing protein n=1 Tax=Christiangramia sabulilitoris TaxID=2583991 RepID=A0A550I782_9FLAO|nr:DUF2306 domain-containing protein [Christiangramia sabulilitoris]TRO66834.1 DUF2306 domain-containing protein [Christiangramia sabulilitoris]
MPQDVIGWFHTIAAIIALLSGSILLLNSKGTISHKRIGKIYVISMFIVCISAFLIYRVHNAFGILHCFAIISTITLIMGMIPIYVRGFKNPILTHLAWMYWSVIGLYCAFAAEIFTRLPLILNIKNSYDIFYALVMISTGIVGLTGSRYFKKKKKVWEKEFSISG